MTFPNPMDILSTESWILLGTLCFLSWYYFHRKWQYLDNLNIPNDPASIMKVGSVAQLFVKPFEVDLKYKEKYGSVWGFYFFTSPSIVVHDPDMIRQIYIKEFASFPLRQDRLTKIYGKELGAGVTVVKGEQWKRIRSAMTPTFSLAKLRQMIPIMAWCADNAVKSLERKNDSNKGAFNAKELFSRLSLDIVCSAAFSTNTDSQDDTVEAPQIVVQAKKLFSTPFFSPMMYLSFMFPAMETLFVKLGFSLLPKSVSDFFKNLASYIIGQRKSNQDEKARVDLLTLMLESEISDEEEKDGKKGMTRVEIVGNCMLMILAGYENTGNQMAFLAYNLAMHPDIQTEVQKEIDDMMDSNGETLDSGSVNGLKLLDMCLNESMRLYTPLLRNSRICVKDTTIGGVKFSKGISVAIPVYALAHDPEHWKEPFKFDPERMRDASDVDPITFQPFGGGPRNCVGLRFAMLEIKVAFCKILRNYTLKATDNTPSPPLELLFAGASIRSKVDFDLCAEPRRK